MTRVVFMGTPEFSVPSLRALIDADDFEVVGVITQPDRPAGRGKKMRTSPIKDLALEHDLPLYQPEKLRGDEAIAQITDWNPDVYVVIAYGQILRKSILDIPPKGSINVHGSILPRWRGAAPIQAAIRAGDEQSGVTIMLMDQGMDTGPMLYKHYVDLTADETGESLHDKLAAISGEALLEGLRGYLNGKYQPEAQNNDEATYTKLIQKSDGEIDWTESAIHIDRQVRAYDPWPSAYTSWDGQMLKIKKGRVLEHVDINLEAGQVAINVDSISMLIGTGQGVYAPEVLQLQGRKTLDVVDFVNGMQDIDGAMFGS